MHTPQASTQAPDSRAPDALPLGVRPDEHQPHELQDECCCAEARRRMQAGGLRCTRQRQDVYKALLATRSHPTAEELRAHLAGEGCTMSLATIYNTLDALCTAGLCRKLPSRANGAARYDADLSDHIHVELTDGRVVDVPDEIGRKLLEGLDERAVAMLERSMGVRIADLSIRLYAEAQPTADFDAQTTTDPGADRAADSRR